MTRLQFKLYTKAGDEHGIHSSFTDGLGIETHSYWTAPPESIGHVDVSYLQGRHWNVRTKHHVAFIAKEFKRQIKEYFTEIKPNVYVPVNQLNDTPVVTDTTQLAGPYKIKTQNQFGQKFVGTLTHHNHPIGTIGNDTDGFFVKLKQQPTLREIVQILAAAENYAPAFDYRKFRLEITH